MSAERLTLARLALSRLLEIYTPTNAGRDGALKALRGGVDEFEQAVREDEREQIVNAHPGFKDLDEAAIRADERAKVIPVATEEAIRADEGSSEPLSTPPVEVVTPPPLDSAQKADEPNTAQALRKRK